MHWARRTAAPAERLSGNSAAVASLPVTTTGWAHPPGAVTHLLYLHGFRSSPASTKARTFAACMQAQHPTVVWRCPQLPPSPAAAMATIDACIADWPAHGGAVIGSSLGGYYATVLAQGHPAWRAVLLNPAVDPARDLQRHIGEQRAWHGAERFWFRAEYIAELRALHAGPLLRPERFLAVIASADELLDAAEMQARYAGCAVRLIDGSDHALSDFDDHLPAVRAFLGLG
jgi:uncharacterized protein